MLRWVVTGFFLSLNGHQALELSKTRRDISIDLNLIAKAAFLKRRRRLVNDVKLHCALLTVLGDKSVIKTIKPIYTLLAATAWKG